jgi:drug/metabolite transporter (DMT)-like permease
MPTVLGIVPLLCSTMTAVAWAAAALMFSRLSNRFPPLMLNLLKVGIAAPFLWVLCLQQPWVHTDASTWCMLIASGVLGVVVADMGYLTAIKRAGPAVSTTFMPLIPVATFLLSAAFLADAVTMRMAVGMAVALLGVHVVQRRPRAGNHTRVPIPWIPLMVYVLAQASSNVLNKFVLATVPPLQVSVVRLSVGLLLCVLWLSAQRDRSVWSNAVEALRNKGVAGLVIAASLLGTGIGVAVGAYGMQGLPAGVATTIVATTPLWVLLMEWGVMKKPPTAAQTSGILIAIVGVFIMVTQ